MFSIYINNKAMHCTDGTIYKFKTVKDAVRMVNICYGLSAFKKIVKIRRNNQ